MKKLFCALFLMAWLSISWAQQDMPVTTYVEADQMNEGISRPEKDIQTRNSLGCTDFFFDQDVALNSETTGAIGTYITTTSGPDFAIGSDDFILSSNAEIGTVIINILDRTHCNPPKFEVAFRADENGSPGAVIASRTIPAGVSIFTKEGLSATWARPQSSIFNAHIPITPSVNLTPGLYWLEVTAVIDSPNYSDGLSWTMTGGIDMGSGNWIEFSQNGGYYRGPSATNVNGGFSFALCGSGSNPVSYCDIPLVAACQNTAVMLPPNGQTTISPYDVDGGSTGYNSINVSPSNFNCYDLGSNTVTLTVENSAGNTDVCTDTVTVTGCDVMLAAACQNTSIALPPNGQATITASDVDGGSYGYTSINVSPSNFDCNNLGSNTVTLTVEDDEGNTDECTATVTITNCEAVLAAVCQNTTVALQTNEQVSITASNVDGGSAGYASIDVSPSAFDCNDLGSNIVTLTVEDEEGNTDECTATVTVIATDDGSDNWQATDVGMVTIGNEYYYGPCNTLPGQFIITGSGNNSISSTTDNVAFLSQTLCGDGDIIAKIESVEETGYGGLMIRETTSDGSKQVAIFSNMSNVLRHETRYTNNGFKQVNAFYKPSPLWLKLQRIGSWVFAYYSANGVNFQYVHGVYVPMQSCVEIGLASFTYLPMEQTDVVFNNVTITGNIQELTNDAPTTFSSNSSNTSVINNDVLLYPNPTKSNFTLQLETPLEQTSMVEVINLYGQSIAQQELTAGLVRQEWDTSSWPAGTYLLKIERAGQQPLIKQFVVMK